MLHGSSLRCASIWGTLIVPCAHNESLLGLPWIQRPFLISRDVTLMFCNCRKSFRGSRGISLWSWYKNTGVSHVLIAERGGIPLCSRSLNRFGTHEIRENALKLRRCTFCETAPCGNFNASAADQTEKPTWSSPAIPSTYLSFLPNVLRSCCCGKNKNHWHIHFPLFRVQSKCKQNLIGTIITWRGNRAWILRIFSRYLVSDLSVQLMRKGQTKFYHILGKSAVHCDPFFAN